ncbi:ribulose 1,5-bisphosphate synthetase/thiazole synthase [Bradyrhizobium sp. LB14.3]|uniref:hypothetical protein n=1 Tax=Bradyrhizobium sp. LB14.3 TaxID=3156328 RepID=UPI00339AEE09
MRRENRPNHLRIVKKSVFGYKIHTGVDAGHTIIRRIHMRDASVSRDALSKSETVTIAAIEQSDPLLVEAQEVITPFPHDAEECSRRSHRWLERAPATPGDPRWSVHGEHNTEGIRLTRKLTALRQEAWFMHVPLATQHQPFPAVLRGHYGYYGRPHN